MPRPWQTILLHRVAVKPFQALQLAFVTFQALLIATLFGGCGGFPLPRANVVVVVFVKGTQKTLLGWFIVIIIMVVKRLLALKSLRAPACRRCLLLLKDLLD